MDVNWSLNIRLAILSDTHQLHREIQVPPADLLIHAGDWTMCSESVAAIADFDDWLSAQPIRSACVLSPGNHESYLSSDPSRRSLTGSATVLINEGLSVSGLNVWACPVTPMLGGGAFSVPRAGDRISIYAQISVNTHVLITHSPPYGILDFDREAGVHRGCPELLEAVRRVQPLLHIFGHVHGARGLHIGSQTTSINAAMLRGDGGIVRVPYVVDVPML